MQILTTNLDDSTVSVGERAGYGGDMYVRDGFPGQRLQVLPRPVVERALGHVPTSMVLTTDAGYFPHASHHGRSRKRGAAGAVIIVCTAGRGRCDSDDVHLAVEPGQALVLGPGVPHLYRADDVDPWTIWWVHLAGSTIPDWMDQLGARDRPVLIALAEINRLVDHIAEIVLTMETDGSDASLIRTGTQAWALLGGLLLSRVGGARPLSEPVLHAQQYLRDHLGEPVRVPELARLVGLSPSHFAAVFREATGGGVIEYLTRLRMARARELLGLTRRTVAEIALDVGYEDAFYFSRQFRKLHGCSPSEFRAGFEQGRI